MITESTRLGPLLRARRETLGLSLEDVEAAIRIRTQYLLALEADEWQRLPGEVVGRGFLQNYADFLKLDGQALKRHRQSETLARLNADWSGTSAGAPMPPRRDMDYRPLEAQQTGAFFLTGQGPAGVWRRFLFTALLVVAVGLVTAGFFLNQDAVWQVGPVLPDLRRNVTTWVQSTYRQLAAGLSTTAPDGEIDPDGEVSPAIPIVEVSPPAPTLQPPPADAPGPTPTATPEVNEPPTPVPTAPNEPPTPAPTPAPTPLPEDAERVPVDCATDGLQITRPGDGQIVQGTTLLTGTAAVSDQWYYKLEYRIQAGAGQAQRQAFTYFGGQVTSVVEGPLGELNTLFMANGTYTVRLTAVQQAGAALSCDLTVTVRN